jgi:hypothetical protein
MPPGDDRGGVDGFAWLQGGNTTDSDCRAEITPGGFGVWYTDMTLCAQQPKLL